MDDYARLREILNYHPAGAPAGEEINEILRILFTPEEVRVALGMGFSTRSAAGIAAEVGVSEDEARARCEAMADKGIIFAAAKNGETRYSLLPTIPGLFEFPFMTGGGTPMHAKLGKLWDAYHKKSMGAEFAASPTPLTRVIPIEATLESRNEVLPYEIISGLLAHNETFALAECACRASLNRCDQPRDVCLIFDKTGRYLIERRLAREITREQAAEVVARAEEAGLVHMTNNSQDRLNLICNCCPCCCTLLRGMTELKKPTAFAVSRYVATFDADGCTGCGICQDERCPVDAVKVEDDAAVVDADKCIGCGLCVTACPDVALKLQPRSGAIEPPKTTTEMAMKVLSEKGRLEGFMKLMKK